MSNETFSEQIKATLLETGKAKIDGFGVFILLPRKQGKIYSGLLGKYVDPTYKRRVRFIPEKQLKDAVCK